MGEALCIMTEVSKWFEEKEALCMDQLWVNTIALLEGRECAAIHGVKDRRCATDTSYILFFGI